MICIVGPTKLAGALGIALLVEIKVRFNVEFGTSPSMLTDSCGRKTPAPVFKPNGFPVGIETFLFAQGGAID
jgi:hypothetical protein